MAENMDEALVVVFELGRESNMIRRYLAVPGTQGNLSEGFRDSYGQFRIYANKMEIDLPADELRDETAELEMKQFYRNQVAIVERYIFQHKTWKVQEVFQAGDCIRDITFIIFAYKAISDQAILNDFAQRLSHLVTYLKRSAKCLGIEISGELSKINDHESLDEHGVQMMQLALKMKLCRDRSEPKRSEIDETRIITDDYWAISLVRLPDAGNNREHAFLVLEGKTGNKSMIWFADFVLNDPSDFYRPGMRKGNVRMNYHESEGVVDSSSKLLFQCRIKSMEIRRGDHLLYSTWPIPKPTAEKLIQNIKTQENNPPQFNILGDGAVADFTGAIKRKPTGHNCFTFARKVLRDLNDDYIDVPEDRLGKWLLAATSRVLVDKQFNSKWWEASTFPLMFVFLAGAVIAYLFFKLL